ncbi:MAG: hypothetical protein GY788_30010 [bacterium]|nr:hypothetical protein [bacterium]
MDSTDTGALLSINDLAVRFSPPDRDVNAVNSVDIDVHAGPMIMAASLGFVLIAFATEERINPRL